MKEPIRCFEGEHKPHEAFWSWRGSAAAGARIDGDGAIGGGGLVNAAEEEGEAELELYGYISEYSWWEDDVTPQMFKDDLMRYGNGKPITVRINSYGGDVIAASMISTMIKDYPARVTVQIDGVAASAASVVAVAGDVIRMQETAYFMIHDPMAVFMLASLNIEELERMANMLKSVKEGIVNAYESRTGLSRPRLAKMMTDETWLDAGRAVDLGFADFVVKGGLVSPKPGMVEGAAVVNVLRNFVNVPAQLLAPATAPEEPVVDPRAERLRAEVQILRGDRR